MLYVNRALHQRWLRTRRISKVSLAPGGVDLQNAYDLHKSGTEAPPLTKNELDILLPEHPLRIGVNGILEYGPRTEHPRVTEVSHHSLMLFVS